MKNILFMGTPEFAAEILRGIINGPYNVVGVVTQPDRKVGRKQILTASPVKVLALENDIPVYQPEKFADSSEMHFLQTIEDIDLIVTAAYGQKLPMTFINSVSRPAVNVHASLLPKYRGGAPIHHAIWKGEIETGISIMYMEEEIDAGAIIAQRTCMIERHDNVGSMFEKLAGLGRELLLDSLVKIFGNEVFPISQDDSKATYAPIIKREQEQLNWEQNAQEIHNHIRAFNPWPGTYSYLNGQRIKIWQGQPCEMKASDHYEIEEEGTIVKVTSQALIVKCGQNTYYAIELWQESGKKKMAIKDYLKGNQADNISGLVFKHQID